MLDINDMKLKSTNNKEPQEVYCQSCELIAETLVNCLIEKGLTVATAESCTGGMIAASIVSVPNASMVFGEGIVSYSNHAKEDRLGVSSTTLEKYGAVSEQTATQMVLGLLKNGADVAIATTGIAGPSGGTQEKPVGLVYIAVASKSGEYCINRMIFSGDRQEIREKSSKCAMHFAIQHISNLIK